ncbi:MAG: leucine-rich repeat domain-containing protein [Clostridia bacterium]|nr:leucine-rich repeat domain-containing protein [Clostridia bacterium]
MSRLFASFPAFLEPEYEPVKRLSVSKLCETFLVYDRACGRKAVVKRALRDDGLLENEYRVCTQLAGEGLPICYRLARDGETVCLVREYVEGKTLSEMLGKPLGPNEALRIVIDLCRILRRFHDHQPPFVHRDIKAENIVLRPDGRCSLIDTGTVRLYDEVASRDTQVLGTPVISPPEQYGYRQTDPRSDVYALGVLLHQLTTGSVDLSVQNPHKRIALIVQHCTRFDPARRYAHASAVEAACRQAQRGHSFRRRAYALASVLAFAGALALAALSLRGVQPRLKASAPAPSAAVSAEAFPAASSAAPALSPMPSSTDTHAFASKTIEAAVCAQLDKAPGTVTYEDLTQIHTLLIFGDQVLKRMPELSANGATLRLDGQALDTRGTVSTLEDLRFMPNLRVLALCAQQISDLSPLSGLGLTRLALHDNLIRDLSPLAQCPHLQELYVGANPVEDFSPLAQCGQLETLYAGATSIHDISALAQIPTLYTLELGACPNLGSLEALIGSETLHYLTLRPVSRAQLAQVGQMTSLRGLFLWQTEGLSDLTPLSELAHLQVLFLDTQELTSLEGIESLTELRNVGLFKTPVADLTPLASLPKLNTLDVTGLSPQSWEPLTQMASLAYVECDASQKETIQALLPNVLVTVSP